MARALYFRLVPSGERLNLAQARFFEPSGSDLIVHWNSGTGAADTTTFIDGASNLPAIDQFLSESQDVEVNIDTVNNVIIVELLFIAVANGFLSNQDLIAGLQGRSAQSQNTLDPVTQAELIASAVTEFSAAILQALDDLP